MANSRATEADPAAAVFDARVETAAAEAAYPPFPFIGLDGSEHYLPHPLMMSPEETKVLQEIEADPDRQSTEFLERFYPTQWAAISEMRPAVQLALLRAWNAEVGDIEAQELDMGKSPRTSSAPNRAQRRSKRT